MVGELAPVTPNGGGNAYNRGIVYDSPVSYDSGLFTDPDAFTLGSLRRRLNVRLGFYTPKPANGAAEPTASQYPPGVAALLDDFLASSQRALHQRYPRLSGQRYFTIQLAPGARLYDVPIDGKAFLDLRRIVGAFLTDTLGNQAWPLNYGIGPGFSNQGETGRPWCFEIRDAIEVWPAPDTTYFLRLQGDAGLYPLVADTDVPSVDGELLFLSALARAKKHYGQPDADVAEGDAKIMLGKLTAGTHVTARYVPGCGPRAPLARPLIKGLDVP